MQFAKLPDERIRNTVTGAHVRKEMIKLRSADAADDMNGSSLSAWLFAVVICFLALALFGCGKSGGTSGSGNTQVFDHGGSTTIKILSGSENKELSKILDDFAKKEKIRIEMDYEGSLDIMRALQSDTTDYDAVWPASSMWITAGDTSHRIKHVESISITPVVFGIKQSLAEELGFVGKDVSVNDILTAIRDGKLKFCMTSASQSNSGCSAYIGFLYALLGNPEVITSDMLDDPALAQNMKALLSGVDRSSGSSDWLKDMFLAGNFDAMVNYECLIISANQELEKRKEEPLYIVYPYDGLSIADSPLGYIDQGDSKKEDAFLKLQTYLLSDEAQNAIQRTGRRTGYTGISEKNSDIFRTDWGVQPDRVLSPFKMPQTDVLFKCLNLYQTQFRKPSLTVYCLDYSGSMSGEGRNQMVEAMRQILDQNEASKNFLQASENEVNIVLPFDGYVRSTYEATGNGDELKNLLSDVENEEAGGGTDIYGAATEALSILQSYDLSAYTPAIILMTDGMSQGSFGTFKRAWKNSGLNVPVFSIMFGDADSKQLKEIAEYTNARVFDGRTDLTAAFRAVKGYN